MDIVLTLVFSIVMLFFMIYPAMKILEWIDERYPIPQRYYTPAMMGLVVLLSLMIGVFLRYA
jgi:UDP-N-acetylmuramyl pentapeptide phosphotransferase/UDP-N-acetylglucosamine-1-phosphate transferase